MTLLVDANLSPALADELRDAGHKAVHVIDVGLATAIDPEIVDYADANSLVIVTVDTDFPMLIALRRATSPSVVPLRGQRTRTRATRSAHHRQHARRRRRPPARCHRVART